MDDFKGEHIVFCTNCKWHRGLDKEDKIVIVHKCPNCGKCCWQIYEFKYYEKGKLISEEAGLTDDDDNFICGKNIKDIKDIVDTGYDIIINRLNNKEEIKE